MNHPDRAPGVRLVTDYPRDERALAQIRGLPEVEVVEETSPVEQSVALMERSCGGWAVELRLTPEGIPAILVRPGFDATPIVALVPPDKALDAFDHPFCYLPR